MKSFSFLFALIFFGLSSFAQSGVNLEVQLVTGSDDLRGGNNATLKINFRDNSSSREYDLGGGFGQNSSIKRELTLDGSIRVSQIRSFTIRHDGSPRNPFDSYDNWDLQSVTITLLDEDNGGAPAGLYNSASDSRRSRFVTRFTGDNRTILLFNQYRPSVSTSR